MAEETDPVRLVNNAEEQALRPMESRMKIWEEAIRAYSMQGDIGETSRVNIKAGEIIADTETIVPRDVNTLLGSRPYMPLGAIDTRNSESVQRVEKITRLLDRYADRNFFMSFTDALRLCRLHGISYIEPRWSFLPKIIEIRKVARDMFGRLTGFAGTEQVETVEENMEWRVLDPWQVRPAPYGNSLDEKPWIVIAEIVPVETIIQLVDSKAHPYKLPKDVDEADLRKYGQQDDPLHRLRRDSMLLMPGDNNDVGILLRYYQNPTKKYPNGRWIHTWNRTILLMDEENFGPLPKNHKPVAALRNISHVSSDRYWPIGLYEFTKDLIKWGDKILSLYFDGVMQNSAQWVAYNPDLVDEEDLRAQPGQRIPVEGGRFAEALLQMKVGQPPVELFDLSRTVTDMKDKRVGIFAYQRGNEPIRKETATAATILTDAGAARMQFGVLQIEQTGLADIADIASKTINANITDGERNRILGFIDSYLLGSADPDSIAGGYVWEFKGSDKIQRQSAKLERELQAYNLMRNQPTIISPWVMDRQLLKDLDVYTEEQLKQMGLTEEQQMAMQQQQMSQQQMGAMPPEQPPPVGEAQAIANPNAIRTPAVNQANKVAV